LRWSTAFEQGSSRNPQTSASWSIIAFSWCVANGTRRQKRMQHVRIDLRRKRVDVRLISDRAELIQYLRTPANRDRW
jgi:hypothetical protein